MEEIGEGRDRPDKRRARAGNRERYRDSRTRS